MNQIEAILETFTIGYQFSGLYHLWAACNNNGFLEAPIFLELYPNEQITIEYDPDTAFFKALQILLESGEYCLFHNLNGGDPTRDGEHLTVSPIEQLEMYKKTWIGKQAMDEMNEENDYVGWWFLVHAPYSLAWKQYDAQGELIQWWHAE